MSHKPKMITAEFHDGTSKQVKFKAKGLLRQGDTLLECVSSIPKGAKPGTLKGGVIAEGEVTGHAHRLQGKYSVHVHEGKTYFTVGEGGVRYAHEDHGHLILPEGTSYCIGADTTKSKTNVATPNTNSSTPLLGSTLKVQREWSPEGDRSVRD